MAGSELDKYTQQVFGFEPEAERLDLLPYPEGALSKDPNQAIDWSNWTAPQWIYDMGKAAVLPEHAQQGGEYSYDDALGFVMEVAGGGFGASQAVGLPKNSLGMFGGELAKGANLDMMDLAIKRLGAGEDPALVWKETGWGMAPDGKMRFEFPDNAAKPRQYQSTPKQAYTEATETAYLKGDEALAARAADMKPYAGMTKNELVQLFHTTGEKIVDAAVGGDEAMAKKLMNDRRGLDSILQEMASRDVGPMSNFVSHGEFGKQYPDLYKLHTRIDADELGDSSGAYLRKTPIRGEQILLRHRPGFTNGVSTPLHELQHGVQQREGFSKGGSPELFQGKVAAAKARLKFLNESQGVAAKRLDEITTGYRQPKPGMEKEFERVANEYDMALEEKIRIYDEAQADPVEQYMRLFGEAEARQTTARANMTMEERLSSYPYDPNIFFDQTNVRLEDLNFRK
ncbi:hypothetical protein N9917_02410 [Deltaproteobacteria bacterium]|nr:hypothetical protein [Deltaproteobacteria bacterium]